MRKRYKCPHCSFFVEPLYIKKHIPKPNQYHTYRTQWVKVGYYCEECARLYRSKEYFKSINKEN